jgi:hypothetical protein
MSSRSRNLERTALLRHQFPDYPYKRASETAEFLVCRDILAAIEILGLKRVATLAIATVRSMRRSTVRRIQ